jgi:hypothetical protein
VLTVRQPASIFSPAGTTFTVGAANTFTVQASGFPAPAIALTGGTLPTGVTLTDNGNGTATLAGNPASGTGGNHALQFTASGFGAPATQAFTLTVHQAPLAVADAYNVVHDSVNAPFASILANDTGVPPPTLMSVTGTGPACSAFPCTINTANGSATVAADGTFTYTPAANFAGSDGFSYVITNVVASSGAAVTITVDNALPVVDLDGAGGGIDFAATFTEGGPAAIVNPTQLTVTDADSPQLASATIVLTNVLDAGSETLAVACIEPPPGCSGAIQLADVVFTTAAGPPATATLTITRVAPLANYQALLRTLTYANTSENPTTTPRSITVTVNDRIANNSPAAVATVAVSGVNDPPTVTAPATAITQTNTPFVFPERSASRIRTPAACRCS